jgi:hypothetical protein
VTSIERSEQVPAESAETEVFPDSKPSVEGTGDPRVDGALDRLEGLEALPVSAHVGEYEAVHGVLQDALATIDEG